MWYSSACHPQPEGTPGRRGDTPRRCRPALPDTARLAAVSLQLQHEVIGKPEHIEPDLDGESGYGHGVPEAVDRRVVGDRVLFGDGEHQSQTHGARALRPAPLLDDRLNCSLRISRLDAHELWLLSRHSGDNLSPKSIASRSSSSPIRDRPAFPLRTLP